MADTQSSIYAQAYGRNIMHLAQQGASKLMGTVFQKSNVTGKVFFQDQIGQWEMETKGGRNVATPNNDPMLSRRMGVMVDYHDNRMLDRGDELRSISDPKSAYTIAASKAIGRKFDDVIFAAMIGTSYSGETGSTSVTNGNIVNITAASPTITVVANVSKALNDYDIEGEDRFIACNTTLLAGMMNLEQATSSDYMAVKALIRGELNTWMGFEWIMSTRLPSTEVAIAWQKLGMCLAGMDGSPMVRTDERSDLSYSWQVYYEINAGCTRLEEERVVRVQEG